MSRKIKPMFIEKNCPSWTSFCLFLEASWSYSEGCLVLRKAIMGKKNFLILHEKSLALLILKGYIVISFYTFFVCETFQLFFSFNFQ